MDFIAADRDGIEQGFFLENLKIDFEIGKEKNDFEIQISSEVYDAKIHGCGTRIYAYDTEFGGVIEEHKVTTADNTIKLCGYTWRGLLDQKIIEPLFGEDYKVMSGDANNILSELIDNNFDGIITGSKESSLFKFNNYQFDRYCTLLSGLTKMLKSVDARLDIKFDRVKRCVIVSAVPIVDYSEQLEYSQDQRLNFETDDYQMGINHLICLGQGDLKERAVLHLYIDQKGNIGHSKYHNGLSERVAVYDYSSVESQEELEKGGIERLQELSNYKSLAMTIESIPAEIGDIVGGRERITGMYAKKQIVSKILRKENRTETIEFKLEGEG